MTPGWVVSCWCQCLFNLTVRFFHAVLGVPKSGWSDSTQHEDITHLQINLMTLMIPFFPTKGEIGRQHTENLASSGLHSKLAPIKRVFVTRPLWERRLHFCPLARDGNGWLPVLVACTATICHNQRKDRLK